MGKIGQAKASVPEEQNSVNMESEDHLQYVNESQATASDNIISGAGGEDLWTVNDAPQQNGNRVTTPLPGLEERDRERDQKLAQMLYEQEQQREQKEREKERMSEQREKQRDEKLAQMLREQEQRNEAKLDRIQSELAKMRDACKEIPDLVQSLAGEMQKLQISQARLEDNVQTLTNRVDNVEIDARKSIDAYLEVQAQKVEKELNEWVEIKDREISAKIESDVKTAVEQATAAAGVNIDASAAALHAELAQIKSGVTAELPNWQQEVARRLSALESNVNSGRQIMNPTPRTDYCNNADGGQGASAQPQPNANYEHEQHAIPCGAHHDWNHAGCNQQKADYNSSHSNGSNNGNRQEHRQQNRGTNNGNGYNGNGYNRQNRKRHHDGRMSNGYNGNGNLQWRNNRNQCRGRNEPTPQWQQNTAPQWDANPGPSQNMSGSYNRPPQNQSHTQYQNTPSGRQGGQPNSSNNNNQNHNVRPTVLDARPPVATRCQACGYAVAAGRQCTQEIKKCFLLKLL
ncbi:E3 ubiquitin-protein ligase BRE1A-like [Schistocerca americana]|uniref:E3 ubiquitin-protein ligase BRE1A-like n=1 Tax=Schistocerca americana TaxID=7009 RepID=UPI001F4FECAE|nr:E3 ubiquitin-protein ligase BRE1A-like [Schistocerca americana]